MEDDGALADKPVRIAFVNEHATAGQKALRVEFPAEVTKLSRVLPLVFVVLLPCSSQCADVEFEVLPGTKTGLKQAVEQWYELEMKRQGGPGKQSHGWWPWGIRVFDFDRDGALDIIASHRGVPNSIILRSHLKKEGALRFANVTTDLGLDNRDLPGADDRPWIWDLDRADFDNDGRLDLVVSNPRLGLAAVFQNEGKGSFKLILSLTGCWDSNPIAIADLDNDGRMDLVIGGSQGKDSRNDITIYRNTTKSAGHYL